MTTLLPILAGLCVDEVIVFIVFWNIGIALCRAVGDDISRSL